MEWDRSNVLSFTVELLPLASLSNNAGEAIARLGADIHQLPQSGVAGHGVSQPWQGRDWRQSAVAMAGGHCLHPGG